MNIMKFKLTDTSKSFIFQGIALGTLLTVFAQIVRELSLIYTLFWFSLVLYLAIVNRDRAKFKGLSLSTVLLAILLGAYCSLCYLLSGEFGYLTGFCQLYLKCLLMYLIGYLTSYTHGEKEQGWMTILSAYALASCVYVAWALINYFPGLDAWLSNEEYLFEGKNSLGQIAGVAAVFLIAVGVEQGSLAKRATCLIVSVCLMFGILLVQCRTAVLAYCVAVICLLIIKKKIRMIVAVAVLFAFCISTSPLLQSILSHALFIDKHVNADFNTMSSGRLGYWVEALNAVKGNELMGLGDYYVDNLYIDLYVNTGIIGFILFMCQWIPRVILNFKRTTSRDEAGDHALSKRIVACMTAFYIVESMLEGYPPFGPGTCSFIFWMLCGFLDSDASNLEERSRAMARRGAIGVKGKFSNSSQSRRWERGS